MTATIAHPPRVAMASVGIGKVQRGFERYFSDLFAVLRDRVDITLYKSGGNQTDRERIPPVLKPLTVATRMLPLGKVAGGAEYRHYKHDCLGFALALVPQLWRGGFDVVHVIDYPLAKALQALRRAAGFRAGVLFTNGCCMPPQYYPPVAHVHHVADVMFRDALAGGVPASHMTMIPCGVHMDRFVVADRRSELRRKHGIRDETFVILAVTAIKRLHKRVDHLVDEVSRLDGDVLLWIDGNPEDQSVCEQARAKLGPRCRITHVPTTAVPELYKLADVMAHAALEESFGLAIVEALSTGLTVFTHDSPHFRWLVQDNGCLVDMSVPGKLSSRIDEFRRGTVPSMDAVERATAVRRRFDWRNLAEDYIQMYAKLAQTAAAGDIAPRFSAIRNRGSAAS